MLEQSHMLVSQEWCSSLNDARRFTDKSQSSLLEFDTPINFGLAPFHAARHQSPAAAWMCARHTVQELKTMDSIVC